MSVTPRTGIFRYVRHGDADVYCQLGWMPTDALDGTHHGQYAVLMHWLCECKYVEASCGTAARSDARSLD